jgi:hypothetical protein
MAFSVATAAAGQTPMRTASLDNYGGVWRFSTDDGTYFEQLELAVDGDRVRGVLAGFERGYFSRRTTQKAQLSITGVVRGGRLELRLHDASSGKSADGLAWLRGEYLALRINGRLAAYARPGTPLVRDASGSPEAIALARAVAGRIYQTSTQAAGRNASVGSRMKFAFCANGEIAYDESDVAAVSGPGFGDTGDMGSTTSRRGQWSIVMYGGAPTVMAHWRGTGTSYSLTAYFDVVPSADGRSADVNGTRLPLVGKC